MKSRDMLICIDSEGPNKFRESDCVYYGPNKWDSSLVDDSIYKFDYSGSPYRLPIMDNLKTGTKETIKPFSINIDKIRGSEKYLTY